MTLMPTFAVPSKSEFALAFCFFSAIGALIALIGVILMVRTAWFVAHATKTTGIVCRLERHPTGDEYYPIFSFKDASGLEFTIHSDAGLSICKALPGEKIPVLYSPANPTQARMASFGALWVRDLILTGFGIFVGGMAVFFVMITKCSPCHVDDTAELIEQLNASGGDPTGPPGADGNLKQPPLPVVGANAPAQLNNNTPVVIYEARARWVAVVNLAFLGVFVFVVLHFGHNDPVEHWVLGVFGGLFALFWCKNLISGFRMYLAGDGRHLVWQEGAEKGTVEIGKITHILVAVETLGDAGGSWTFIRFKLANGSERQLPPNLSTGLRAKGWRRLKDLVRYVRSITPVTVGQLYSPLVELRE